MIRLMRMGSRWIYQTGVNVFNFKSLVPEGLPAPESRWTGFPEYNYVGGHNDPESLPMDTLIDCMSRVLKREGTDLATYGLQSGPQGYLGLREYLVQKLATYSSMTCTADDILLTSGSLQGMDLLNQAMLQAGDVVIAEESNYGGALSRFRRLGVEIVAIPVDQDGMQTDVLAKQLEVLQQADRSPKFIYTIPTVHNPTGSIMTLPRRKALLEIARQYDLAIFEDECYADLVWAAERPPALYALDTDSRVVYVGSFSKTVAPALRVGFIVAPWSILGQVLSLKTDAGSGALEQMLLAEFCPEHFDSHLSRLNIGLKKKLDTLVAAIDREFGTSVEYCYPPGGIFLWLQCPDGVDTAELSKVAMESGIAVNPGNEWSLQQDSNRYIRLCFANPDHQLLDEGVARLASVCHDRFGVPEYGGNVPR